ncbi:hypothetical protein [Promicromonospora panici]|uniref:hypothetical protein n=1 Tax=Promicromonospora panici TaxID=2219658 RepID=UPI00101DA75E|nr:hypothetical protein [Promicromonospora panici]
MTGSVAVSLLARALEHLDWRLAGGIPGLYQVWLDPEGQDEIIVPLDDSKSDFDVLAKRALDQVRRIPGAPIDLVANHREDALDQLIIRSGADSASALPPPDIVRMEVPVLELLATAGKLSWVRGGFDAGIGELVARQVLGMARIERGDSWAGSMAVQLPSNARFGAQDSRLITGEPAEGMSATRVMDALEANLSAAAQLARERSDLEGLDQIVGSVDPRIAYELFGVLARFLRAGRGVITFERVRPGSQSGQKQFELLLDERIALFVDEAGERFFPAAGRRDVILVGEVIPVQPDYARSDHDYVVLIDVLNGEFRRAYLGLSSDAYRSSVLAYREGRLVRVRGRVSRDGGQLWMHLPTVEVLDKAVPADDIPVRESGARWNGDDPS